MVDERGSNPSLGRKYAPQIDHLSEAEGGTSRRRTRPKADPAEGGPGRRAPDGRLSTVGRLRRGGLMLLAKLRHPSAAILGLSRHVSPEPADPFNEAEPATRR